MAFPSSLPGGLSSDPYLDRRLRPLDAEHYCAAGLLLYRRRDETLEVLLPRERPWNSFTQAYDPLAWNLFGGKRVPRQERSADTTAVRVFLETMGPVQGAPDQEKLYGMMQDSFNVWYPMGKFGLVVIEVPGDSFSDLPENYEKFREQSGPHQEYQMLPMGIKKWSKQIDEVKWIDAASLLSEDDKADVSDLFGSMLQISAFRDFLGGSTDPAKALPDGGPVAPPPRREGGKGKGKKGGGKGGEGWKGGGGGGKGGGGSCQKGYKGAMCAKGSMGPGMMYAGGKGGIGMPVMSPMVYPSYDNNSAEMQRQMYGEQLYVLVQPMAPSPYLAQKITGMLLELPQNELLLNLTNQEELSRRVREALDVLREDGVA